MKPDLQGTTTVRSTYAVEKRGIIAKEQINLRQKTKRSYSNFNDLVCKLKIMKLDGYSIDFLSLEVTLKKMNESYIIPEFELFIDTDLNFTIRVFGWLLPETHQIYNDHGRSVYFITVYKLLCQVSSYKLCEGIQHPDVKSLVHLKKHIISKQFHLPSNSADMMDISFSEECTEPACEDEYVRSIECTVLIQEGNTCKECRLEEINHRKSLNKKSKIAATPAHKKAPVSLTSPDRIRLTFQNQRSENKCLLKEIANLRD